MAARTQAVIAWPSSLVFVRRLLGATRLSLGLGLGRLLQDIGCDACRHQPLQFITAFLTPLARRGAVREAVAMGDVTRAAYLLGRAGSRRLVGDFLRYCPLCARRQRRVHGEAYWMRLPQIVGITCCPIHRLKLCDSAVSRRHPGGLPQLESYLRQQDPAPPLLKETNLARLRVAREAQKLLDYDPPWDGRSLDRGWRELLRVHGIAAFTRGAIKSLQRDLADLYGEDYLDRARCGFGLSPEHSWVARFIRHPAQETDPLRHLLVLIRLGENLEGLEKHAQLNPFALPAVNPQSLTCRNLICPDKGGTVGQIRCFRERRTGCDITQFTCRTCDATVEAFSGGDKRRDRVIDRGDLWRNRLRECWNDPSLSLRELARRLDADPMTIKREAVKLSLSFPRASARPTCIVPRAGRAKSIDKEKEREKRRAAWLGALKRVSFTKKARALVPPVYAWLYRNDRLWLSENRPPRDPVMPSPRTNWLAREQEFLRRLPSAHYRIISYHPFIRCSQALLFREIKAERYLKYLDRMPELKRQSNEVIEDAGRFALRRIIASAKEHREGLTFSKLRKLAGISVEMSEIPAVQAILHKQLCKKGQT